MANNKRSKQLLMVYVFLFPSLLIFLMFRIIPIIWNLILSFYKWNFMKANEFIGLTNYITLIKDTIFWQSFNHTLVYFFIGTPISITLAVLVAILVNQPIKGKNFYRVIIFLPYPITPVATAVIWNWMYNDKIGLFNFVLRSLGIIHKGIPFLQSFQLALPSVIVASIWQVLGYFVILMLSGLQTIPNELYEASRIDGARPIQQTFKITLPLLKPTIFICFIVGIINSFTAFDLIYVMTNGGPGHATEIMITYIYKNAFTFSRIGYASSITIVLFLFLLFITWLSNLIAGGEAGAIKYYE